jgi:N-acyl-D-aspartate/D-glutamate deacylase
VASEANAGCVGRTIAEIAAERSCGAEDAIFDLLIEERGEVNILEFNQSEENLRRNVTHPLAIIISDGFYVKGRPHPRLHGTFPELLGRICRELRWLPLEQAIHKITGFPAERFGLQKIGLLREGYLADVTVFDPERIRSHASYDDPERAPEGIAYVFREGQTLLAPASQTL